MVSLANFSLTGIEGTLGPNPRRAEHLLFRAAALYQDAEAQYQLGALYQSDRLGPPQMRSAARWYGLAAKKGHATASASLGRMLVLGDGVPRRPVRGLVLLMKAKTTASDTRVLSWYDEAVLTTTEEERALANDLLATSSSTTNGLAQDANPSTELN